MPSVCLYFQVHQPYRVKRYRVFDIGRDQNYFNDESETDLNNGKVLRKVDGKCYQPATRLLLELLERHPEFKVSFSFSGVALEQLAKDAPETLALFQALVKTGRAEVLGETYYHSLAFLYSPTEFRHQVRQHRRLVRELFNVEPAVFRHTELIYNNDLAAEVAALGYTGILAEGADHILGWRSPNYLYHSTSKLPLLLKNYKLSDDIAFRFSSRDWSEHPLTAPKFASWVSAINGGGELVNLFMDYETLGEHQWADTGIFDFLRALPAELLRHPDNNFVTVSEAVARYQPVGVIDAPHFYSWADTERDLSAWLGNDLQKDAAARLYALEPAIAKTKNNELVENWRRLSTSDHLYYMCTKWWHDGDVHKYFNPYETPYDAYISYMNALQDLSARLNG
jgi:alpha-amylase